VHNAKLDKNTFMSIEQKEITEHTFVNRVDTLQNNIIIAN